MFFYGLLGNNKVMSLFKDIIIDTGPDFVEEDKLCQQLNNPNSIIAGVDEAGRGPWAGPVVAAAAILDARDFPEGLNDSKKLSKKKRDALYPLIMEKAQVGIGIATVEEIDQTNILAASLLAMVRAVENLPVAVDGILVDGNREPPTDLPKKCLIKGDSRSLSIAAASIIAKNFRDKIMSDLAKIHPEYGWDKNAGYGVPKHINALRLVGVTPHHRKSFAPIKRILDEDSDTSY